MASIKVGKDRKMKMTHAEAYLLLSGIMGCIKSPYLSDEELLSFQERVQELLSGMPIPVRKNGILRTL